MDLKFLKKCRTDEANALFKGVGGDLFLSFLEGRGYKTQYGFQSGAFPFAHSFRFEGKGVRIDFSVEDDFIEAHFSNMYFGYIAFNLEGALSKIGYSGKRDLKSICDGLMADWTNLEASILENNPENQS